MQDYLHGDDQVPYVERQDLAYEKKKRAGLAEVMGVRAERAEGDVISGLFT